MCNGSGGNAVSILPCSTASAFSLKGRDPDSGQNLYGSVPWATTNTKYNFSKLFHCLGLFLFFFFPLTGKQLLLGNRHSCYSYVSFSTVNIFIGTGELFQLHRSVMKCGWNPRSYLLIHLQLDILLEILRILLLIIQPKLGFPLWSVLQCHPALGN